MAIDLEELTTHTAEETCPICYAQDVVGRTLVPAVEAWELAAELPRFSVALHGAAGLLGTMLAEGVSREQLERTVSMLLQEIEREIAQDRAMGGPPQGTA